MTEDKNTTTTTTDPPATDDPAPAPPVVESNGHQLVHADSSPPVRQVLMPLDTDQVVAGMDAYQAMLPRLLSDSDWEGPANDRFVKKSGWRKIARAFNLSVELVSVGVRRDDTGRIVSAEAVARAKAPNGQVQDGDGYCTTDEFTGKRAGDARLENTMRGTATTRAKNRAIADLVGMGEVSAEEMRAGGSSQDLPAHGPPLPDDKANAAATRALVQLVGGDTGKARQVWDGLREDCGGYVPAAAGRAWVRAALALPLQQAADGAEAAQQAQDPPPDDPQAQDAAEGADVAGGDDDAS